MATSIEGFVAKVERASKQTPKAARVGVEAAGKYLTAAVLASLAADTHGTMKLRGVKSGALGATSRTVSSGETTSVLVQGIPGGLWSWLQKGTHPHIVGAGRGKVGVSHNIHGVLYAFDRKNKKSYATKRLHIGDNVVFGPFRAGGSPARRTFSRAVEATEPELVRIMQREVRTAVLDTFKHG